MGRWFESNPGSHLNNHLDLIPQLLQCHSAALPDRPFIWLLPWRMVAIQHALLRHRAGSWIGHATLQPDDAMRLIPRPPAPPGKDSVDSGPVRITKGSGGGATPRYVMS